ncbi:hypothetical protein O181_019882 [Austropuccinia psidii MF-1]|uniref:Protein kinase domain-containing protein n=1 Tax=Austropuccinia psidii MF-1 TaxID=1389203 RepID=A0A9Q3CCF7_9BASI|nr:hypothetical protein [Austropuccinia psidii MF-1]
MATTNTPPSIQNNKPTLILPMKNEIQLIINSSSPHSASSNGSNFKDLDCQDATNDSSKSNPSTINSVLSNSNSKRPPLTISAVNSTTNQLKSLKLSINPQVNSNQQPTSNHSLSISIPISNQLSSSSSSSSSPASTITTTLNQTQSNHKLCGSVSLYPTTLSSFDPDLEDGGRLNDPQKIIDDIYAAINGGASDSAPLNRTRSGSNTSIRPIPIRRPKLTSNVTNSDSTNSNSTPNLNQTPPPSPPSNSNIIQTSSTFHNSINPSSTSSDPAKLDETLQIEFEPSDLEILNTLGEGAGGEVKRVLHRPSGLSMAKKIIPTSPNPQVHRQILRELAFNRQVADGDPPSIVKYYGAFLEENDTQIALLMEYCEGGSLDAIYKRIKLRQGRIGEKILGKVAESVLAGLSYLHTKKIIHRDIKPSNIVVTRDGLIKLCDLGVSGELIQSLAGTFMGTSAYMAPERIRGDSYSITSDVWSLGLTLLELALNRFPLGSEDGSSAALHPFELLQTIVTFEMPPMNEGGVTWTKSVQHFLKTCLDKNPNQRPGPKILLDQHPWILKSKSRKTDIQSWISNVWDW